MSGTDTAGRAAPHLTACSGFNRRGSTVSAMADSSEEPPPAAPPSHSKPEAQRLDEAYRPGRRIVGQGPEGQGGHEHPRHPLRAPQHDRGGGLSIGRDALIGSVGCHPFRQGGLRHPRQMVAPRQGTHPLLLDRHLHRRVRRKGHQGRIHGQARRANAPLPRQAVEREEIEAIRRAPHRQGGGLPLDDERRRTLFDDAPPCFLAGERVVCGNKQEEEGKEQEDGFARPPW